MRCFKRWKVLLLALFLSWAGVAACAAEYRVRPFWGDAALWNYWEFENDYVSKSAWKIVSVGGGDPAQARSAIDDDVLSYCHLKGKDVYEIVIDLGRSYDLGAFTIVSLQNPTGSVDSRMAKYEFYAADAPEAKGEPVAQGSFEGAMGKETVVSLPAAKGRYVTLRAYARANPNQEVCIRELSLVEAAAASRRREQRQPIPAA